ncbi:MAG: Trk system potassium transporter TrkA [Acidimicrobiales bacterium]|nr:Trk system potassium transporter TrkA [Acidimicrobiales bacterium]
MRIIVVGAGEVGSYVAERLSRQGHHVVLIELDAERFRQVDQDLDVMTLRGSGTDPVALAAAGIEQADLLVAVTPVDETNIVSALLARRAGVSKTVIRVESRPLRRPEVAALFDGADDHLVIDPDEEVAHAVLRLMEYPGAMEVNQMAGGEVEVLTARLPGHAPLVGVSLRALGAELEPDWDFIVGSITRRETDADEERTIIPRGDWILRKGDLLTVICKRRALGDVTARMGLAHDMPTRALLLGGGRTAQMLAESLIQRGLDVAIIEKKEERADELTDELDRRVTVYLGDITDATILEEAGVASQDVVIALTGADDANVLACLYAKAAGARHSRSGAAGPETIAVVHRLQLLDLLEAHEVDATLSPRTATANSVLRFVRGEGETVTAVATSLHGDAEVLEFAVAEGCRCDGRSIADLGLHEDVLIAAIVRDGKPQIGRGRSTLRARDHVIAVTRPDSAPLLSSLFE